MRSALYYPHTTIDNASLVKTALLLWDKLEYIVPSREFHTRHGKRDVQRAMEIIGSPRVPTTAEKKEAHTLVEEMVTSNLPPQFYLSQDGDRRREYEIYPQKLLDETWHMLRESRLSGALLANSDYPMSEPAGLMVMSILADCCAGKTRTRVTDRGAAYATLAGLLGQTTSHQVRQPQTTREQLAHIGLEVINTKSIPLKALIEFREREEKESGHTLRDLRHRYVANLESYVKRITTEAGNESDAREVKRQFADDMRIDLAKLNRELGSAGRDALLSKEVLLTVLAGAGTIASWTFGVPVPILGAVTVAGMPAMLVGTGATANKYLATRRAVLEKHPMAYLYELQQPAVRR